MLFCRLGFSWVRDNVSPLFSADCELVLLFFGVAYFNFVLLWLGREADAEIAGFGFEFGEGIEFAVFCDGQCSGEEKGHDGAGFDPHRLI